MEPPALPIAAPVMAAPNRLKPPGSSAPPMADPTAPRTRVAIRVLLGDAACSPLPPCGGGIGRGGSHDLRLLPSPPPAPKGAPAPPPTGGGGQGARLESSTHSRKAQG